MVFWLKIKKNTLNFNGYTIIDILSDISSTPTSGNILLKRDLQPTSIVNYIIEIFNNITTEDGAVTIKSHENTKNVIKNLPHKNITPTLPFSARFYENFMG